MNPKGFFLGTDQMSMSSLMRIAGTPEALETPRNDRERRSQLVGEEKGGGALEGPIAPQTALPAPDGKRTVLLVGSYRRQTKKRPFWYLGPTYLLVLSGSCGTISIK